MNPTVGSVIYVGDGSQAAIVLGYGYTDGEPDGSVIVGTFAGSTKVAAGAWSSAGPGESVKPGPPPEVATGGSVTSPAAPVEPSHEPGASPLDLGDDEAAEATALAAKDAEIEQLRAELAAQTAHAAQNH